MLRSGCGCGFGWGGGRCSRFLPQFPGNSSACNSSGVASTGAVGGGFGGFGTGSAAGGAGGGPLRFPFCLLSSGKQVSGHTAIGPR